jgi:Histidine kinase-, DNA gyrase B-, and HSP90-like ATPase
MIDDLLEVTRVQGGHIVVEPQCTSVAEVIAFAMSTVRGAALAKGVGLSVELGGELPLARADPTRLRQILIILLDNAIKFTQAGGSIRIRADALTTEPNTLTIEVRDSGCGIDPAMTERIFDRLFQASDPTPAARQGHGLELGLYICRELVTCQGGRIWATSAVGEGAVLSFTVPIFSMCNLLAATLRDVALTPNPVTLLVTQMGSQTGWLSDKARAEHSRGVRELLRRCLRADQDVLLPKMGSSGLVELFFMVAATDLAGGETLAERIQSQFDGRGSAVKANLVISTSSHAVKRTRQAVSVSLNAPLEALAETVHSMVNDELSSRMVARG